MKRLLIALAAMVATSGAANAALIGTYTADGGGGSAAVAEDMLFRIGYYSYPQPAEYFFEENLSGGLVSYELTSGSAFDSFAAQLTDGVDESVSFDHRLIVGGAPSAGGTRSASESEILIGGATGEDFQDYAIDRIVMTIVSGMLDTPGSDPNNNGVWTDFSFTVRLDIFGEALVSEVPLPAAAPLFALALAGGAGFLRRKRKTA